MLGSLSLELTRLFLEKGSSGYYTFRKEFIISRNTFNEINDASKISIQLNEEDENSVVTLDELIIGYISFSEVVQAMKFIPKDKRLYTDKIFITMCICLHPDFGLFFTGRFNYNGYRGLTNKQVMELITMWLERSWNFRHFTNLVEQRLFLLQPNSGTVLLRNGFEPQPDT